MNPPLVISVILNTSRRDDTLECLESLIKNSYSNHKIIVLDNHSTDGSVSAIRRIYPDVRIIELESNLGFAGNNNVGIKAAMEEGADWVFILNEDIILDEECISNLVEVCANDVQIGAAGPLVYHYDEPNIIQSAGGALGDFWESIHLGQNELDQGQFNMPHQVEWISGCAILVKSTVIEQVGVLDSNYFIYWDETEWCMRIGHEGWGIVNVPQSHIWHKGVKRDYQPKPSVTYYTTRNHLFTLAKHKAPLKVWVFTLFHIFRTLVSWTIRPRWRFMREHRNAMWKGLINFLQRRWGAMPSL